MVQFSLIKSVQIKSSEIRIKNSELTVDFDSTHDSGRPSDAPARLSAGPPSTDPTPDLGPQHIRLSPLPADSTTSKSTAPADQRTSQSALAAVAGLNCPNRSTTASSMKITTELSRKLWGSQQSCKNHVLLQRMRCFNATTCGLSITHMLRTIQLTSKTFMRRISWRSSIALSRAAKAFLRFQFCESNPQAVQPLLLLLALSRLSG